MIKLTLTWSRPHAISSCGEIFVSADTFVEDFGYPPAKPVPYFVWSSRRAHVLRHATITPGLQMHNIAGRYVHMISPFVVQVHDFNVTRCGRNQVQPSTTCGAQLEVPRPDPEDTVLVKDTIEVLRSGSLPYWALSRDLGVSLDSGWRRDVAIDEEHIVVVLVSGESPCLSVSSS